MWQKWLRGRRKIKIDLVTEEQMDCFPNDICGLPAFYAFTKDGIKIWPKPDGTDINLYWGLEE